MMGRGSELVTFLPLATFSVPLGTLSVRRAFTASGSGFSKFLISPVGTGVPMNMGLGYAGVISTRSPAGTAGAEAAGLAEVPVEAEGAPPSFFSPQEVRASEAAARMPQAGRICILSFMDG